MKKFFNKFLAYILLFAITIYNISPLLVYAAEQNTEGSQNYTLNMSEIKAKGNIELETYFAFPIRNNGKSNITLTIYDESKNKATLAFDDVKTTQDGIYQTSLEFKNADAEKVKTVRATITKRDVNGNVLTGEVESQNIVYYSVNLYSLDTGKYTLQLSGKNYVTYSVDVTLENFSKRITLSNTKGMFAIGDVNHDNKVDAEDENAMIKAIRNNDLTYDLNLDKKVDIADLNYITAVINSKEDKAVIADTGAILSSENVSLELTSNTAIDTNSSIDNLFIEGETVTLKPTNSEVISSENPVELAVDLGKDASDTIEMSEVRIGVGSLNKPTKLELLVTTDNGDVLKYEVDDPDQGVSDIHTFTDDALEDVIRIDLGRQVAVKKVTIIIKETSSNNLADIASVEFLNNVKVEVEEPEGFYTPSSIHINDTVSEQLTITFQDVPNVTGYEIKIVDPSNKQTIYQTTYNTFTIEDLKNYTTYKLYVQSVNGQWRSGWSDAHEGTPKATRKPPKVDNVSATPTYSGIDFTWKKMDDTLSYKLYYREVGTSQYKVIDNLEVISYSLRGLKASTSYEAYVIGVNELGESDSYTLVTAKTLAAGAAIVPKYNLINDEKSADGRATTHIKNVYYNVGKMTGDNRFAIVDDDYNTYWHHADWQISSNVYYNPGTPVIELDDNYLMDEFVLTVPDNYTASLKPGGINSNDVKVHYWENEHTIYDDTGRKEVKGTLSAKTDSEKRIYYVLKLEKPIKAKAVAFGLTVAANVRDIRIDEVKFYKYDSLVDDVANLFADDLRLVLKENVNQEKINELRQRADETDHGEYSPYRDSVLADLEYAEKILNDEKIDDVITLNPEISNFYNSHAKFAMTISDYQPLGIVARPGETLNIYVGTNSSNVNIQLIYTQYHAEAAAWNKPETIALKKGLNIVTVPTIGSATEERGGSIYIRYTSKPDATKPIKIRVSGGTKIPMVDTTLLETEEQKKEAIKTYIEKLAEYNALLDEKYNSEDGVFDPQISVLGSTEIVTKYGLFSVSSVAVEEAINANLQTIEQKTNRLYESMEAFDEMMELFYRQKGFDQKTTVASDAMPQARINIRYMQMFDGAFMYAGGYHVGIEYGSIAGLVQASRNSDSKTGYFGWGISHEVGHQINLKDTVFAEVTNNIYALLAQTSNDSDHSRLEVQGYDKIYEKVTSHTIGRAQNVFVQLGMYWQLHLAYDENKTFDDTDSVYAKINRIARTYKNTNNYSRDELTILYACMATGKDLTKFFEIWGLKASDKLKAEIKALTFGEDKKAIEEETRAIYYLNDAARRYILGGGQGITPGANILTASINNVDDNNKRVTLSFNVSSNSNDILGYEILRNGVSIGFVENGTTTFTDIVGAENNRAYTYSVVAYDYLLNKTNVVTLDEVKVSHDGSVKKDNFTISSNVKEPGEIVDNENEELDIKNLHVNNLIDGKNETGFKGIEKIVTLDQTTDKPKEVVDTGNAYVIINLNSVMSISGIKYRALVENNALVENTITNYNIYVSSDGEKWTKVRTGNFGLTAENHEATVYFMGQDKDSESQLWTYNDVSYIKIESVGNTNGLSGAEIDVIAPPGDNVEIDKIGVLEKDYCYLKGGCEGNKDGLITEGSVVIQGTYRGNPSFNNVLIANASDEQKVFGGYFLIFAELNSDDTVYDVAEGTWLYVMSREQYEKMKTETDSIRAYLYRVNNAITSQGQRLTSTSKAVNNLSEYNELSKLTLEGKK